MRVEFGFTNKKTITFVLKEFCLFGARARLMEDGTIKKERINIAVEDIKNTYEIENMCKGINIKLKRRIIYLITLLLTILISYVFKNQMCIMFIVFFIGDKLLYKESFFDYLLSMYIFNTQKDFKELRGLHAAEHMAMSAYNILEKIPTVDEVRKYSMFSANCTIISKYKESLSYFICMFVYGLIRTNYSLPIRLLFIVAGIVLAIVSIKSKFYKYFGWFSLRRPTDNEIEVAIVALEEYEAFSREFEEDPSKIFREMSQTNIFGFSLPFGFIVITESNEE